MQEHTVPFSTRVNAQAFYSLILSSIIILVNINLNALITRQFLNVKGYIPCHLGRISLSLALGMK